MADWLPCKRRALDGYLRDRFPEVSSIWTHSNLFEGIASLDTSSGAAMYRALKFGITFQLGFALGAPAVAQGPGACAQIRAVCQSAGFIQGAARLGIGLQVDCIIPIVQGTAQRPKARIPLPQVDPRLVGQCVSDHPRFGRSNVSTAETKPFGITGPPPSAVLNTTPPRNVETTAQIPPPVLEGAPRPTTASKAEERGVISVLPPEDQPEIGPPKLAPQFRRTEVSYQTKEPAGSIIVDTPNTYLYLVLGNGRAMRYGIGVGREGFTWAGTERVSRAVEWPDWHPPTEMIERQPYLPRFMAGGESNPLGARALYLGNTLYRIHGTNQPSTIGSFVSSGCIRLTNEDVIDLYSRVQVGTRVMVLPREPSQGRGG
jgi:lipoprotein-anchoring transpeptidase ErfK/SrfK